MRVRPQPRRGYLLLEALVGGAVLTLAITGLVSAFINASSGVAQATAAQRAAELAQAQLERLRSLSRGHAAWSDAVDAACPGFTDPTNRMACTLTISTVEDTNMPTGPTGVIAVAPRYKRAVVTVRYATYRTSDTLTATGLAGSVVMETFKW